jgi:serine protease Do
MKMNKMYLSLASAAVLMAGMARAQHIEVGQLDPEVSIVRVAAVGTSYLGVNLREIDSDRAKELKLKEETGVEITRVEEDSPAAKAGLKVNDAVLSYNGTRVDGMEQFSRFVRETPAGREVKLVVSRDGNTQTIVARVGARRNAMGMMIPPVAPMPPRIDIPQFSRVMPDMPHAIMMWRTSALGVEVEALRGQLADFFGVKEGVLVRSVIKDTAAAKAGLKAGDVIVKVAGNTVSDPGGVTSAVRSAKDRKAVPIVIIRDHKETTVTAAFDDEHDSEAPMPRHVTGRSLKM